MSNGSVLGVQKALFLGAIQLPEPKPNQWRDQDRTEREGPPQAASFKRHDQARFAARAAHDYSANLF
jgi:hypothetical protein